MRGYFEGMCWPKMLFALGCGENLLRNICIAAFNRRNTDSDIQLKLQTTADVKTEYGFQNIVGTFPERFGFGVTKFAISFVEKSEFIQQITQHFCFSTCSKEIQDFKRGLGQYGLYSILSEHFAHSSKEFSLSQRITSAEIIKLFQTVLYSDASAVDTKKKN